MSENYVDFDTFVHSNVFNGNIVTLRDSNLNANASEFVPRNITDPEVSPEKPLPGNYGNNRRSKGNVSASNRHNHQRINKRNDFWNKNRENASSNTLHEKNQDSTKVSGPIYAILIC